jgi:hypothetical protein
LVEHLTEEPESEPVTLAEAKTQLALETAEDDALLALLISAARRHVEDYCNRGIVQQTWEAVLDAFPSCSQPAYQMHTCRRPGSVTCSTCRACQLWIELPHGHLATLEDDDPAVESITYVDSSGVTQTLASTEYSIDTVSVPGRVHLAYGKSWPTTRQQWDAVRVTYVVGWAADSVPASIKQAILLLVSQMYEKRTEEVELDMAGRALLSPFRILSL